MFQIVSTGLVYIILSVLCSKYNMVSLHLVAGFMVALFSIKMITGYIDKPMSLNGVGLLNWLVMVINLLILSVCIFPVVSFVDFDGRINIDFAIVIKYIAVLYLLSNVIIETIRMIKYGE